MSKKKRLYIFEVDFDEEKFRVLADFSTKKKYEDFYRTFREWFDYPAGFKRCTESFITYFKKKYPNKICLKYEDIPKRSPA